MDLTEEWASGGLLCGIYWSLISQSCWWKTLWWRQGNKAGVSSTRESSQVCCCLSPITAHEDWLDCAVSHWRRVGCMGTCLAVTAPSCLLRAKGFCELHLPAFGTEWLPVPGTGVLSRSGLPKAGVCCWIAAVTCVAPTCQLPSGFAPSRARAVAWKEFETGVMES